MSFPTKIQNDLIRAEKLSKLSPKQWTTNDIAFMQSHLKEIDSINRMREGLPHLFGFPWYSWAKQVFDSQNKVILLTAANQVSKSATMVRKIINWATAVDLWPTLWPGLLPGQKPSLFWYMLPTLSVATTEFETKWESQYLPRNEFKNHPIYGWKAEYHKGEIHQIIFNSGVRIQFRSYTQKPQDLQTASVYFIVLDEECPAHLIPEISARLNATDGYLASCFTATMGQEFWRKAMEPIDKTEETFKDALKIRVSLYESQKYMDGTPSPWTDEKIKRAIQACPTEAEVQRRIYGRFVKSEGLVYEGFSLEKNMSEKHPLPKEWMIFSGIDPGSGGKSGHPTAMAFVAVNPSYTEGRVFLGWRGDGISTSSQDILDKYKELKGSMSIIVQSYDWAAKDFFLIASRTGEAFTPADKGRDRGVALLNTLFKSGMLKIQRGDPELEKLVNELCSLSANTKKTVASDDFVDALRYAIMAVPWDFTSVTMNEKDQKALGIKTEESRPLTEKELRREWFLSQNKKQELTIEDELAFWDDLL